MLFSDENYFEYILLDFADQVRARPSPPINPLPCDRWVARSCLQKAIRRADPVLAQRALANLFNHDRRATWRHLAIIALEDIGVANVDVLARIIAAQRDRKWRDHLGGDWPVLSELIRQMAKSEHCQAACDLLLRALNDPSVEHARMNAVEEGLAGTAFTIIDSGAPIAHRAVAALAMGGGLADGQPYNDASGVFDVLAEEGRSRDIVSVCRAVWRLTRNPMAFLLPMVWEQWASGGAYEVTSDRLPPVQMFSGVPGHALDQFTRIGNSVSRALLRGDPALRQLLLLAGVLPAAQSRTVGDLLFLAEGGLLVNRVLWPLGDELRLPSRQLSAAASLSKHLPAALAHIKSEAGQIAQLRSQYFHPQAS